VTERQTDQQTDYATLRYPVYAAHVVLRCG